MTARADANGSIRALLLELGNASPDVKKLAHSVLSRLPSASIRPILMGYAHQREKRGRAGTPQQMMIGLSGEEIALILLVSTQATKRGGSTVRAWLHSRLSKSM